MSARAEAKVEVALGQYHVTHGRTPAPTRSDETRRAVPCPKKRSLKRVGGANPVANAGERRYLPLARDPTSTLAREISANELRLVTTSYSTSIIYGVAVCPVAALRVSSIVYGFFPAEAAVAAADPATTIAMPRLSTAPGTSPNIAPHDVAHTTAV